MDTDCLDNMPETFEPHVLPIVTWPDERLNTKCAEVLVIGTPWAKQLKLDLIETAQAFNGIAIAAPQVAIMTRIILIDPFDEQILMINPVIQESSKEMFQEKEGCLSVPGYFENRNRPNEIRVNWFDEYGEEHERTFTNRAAFAIQHEIDHLDGKVFVDNHQGSRLKTSRIKSKISKWRKRNKSLPIAT